MALVAITVKVEEFPEAIEAGLAVTFTLGGAAGALLFRVLQERTLLIPAVLTGLCGLTYGLYCQYTMKSASGMDAD